MDKRSCPVVQVSLQVWDEGKGLALLPKLWAG